MGDKEDLDRAAKKLAADLEKMAAARTAQELKDALAVAEASARAAAAIAKREQERIAKAQNDAIRNKGNK